MSELIITNDAKQIVITRLACVNSAVSVLGLLQGRPAKTSVDEVLHLAAQLEAWAWRGLLPQESEPQPREVSPPQDPPPESSKPGNGSSNGRGPGQVPASEKQVNALYAIGKRKGLDHKAVQAWIQGQVGKALQELSSREASGLISQLLDT